MRRCLRAGLQLGLLALSVGKLEAQELEPRSYTNVPIDQTFLVVGYGRTEGDVAPAPTAPIENAFLEIDAIAVGVAHTFELAGSSAKVDASTFRACYVGTADIDGEPSRANRCEWADLRVRLGWNFLGAPALSLEDFGRWQEGFVAGVSLQAELPVGEYASDRMLNAGTNRWMLRPAIGFSYRWDRWFVDGSVEVKVFGDNDDYLGGDTLEQDPIYQTQFHVIRGLGRGSWLSLNANFYTGGESSREALALDNGLENTRLGATFSMPLSRHHTLKFNASSAVRSTAGSSFDTLAVALQYRL